MAFDPHALPLAAEVFLTERHVGTITTLRADGTPHVVPVNFTWQTDGAIVRIITSASSQKVRNVQATGRAVICSVDGRRWLSLEGQARVTDDPDDVADAVRRYTDRYHAPRRNSTDRVAIEIAVDRVLGRMPTG